ncbi:MAG: 4a-hydroxytetrahydrobiopterin dehydratase [Armatimonadota bacterium]
MTAVKLSDEVVQGKLADLSNWSVANDALVKTFSFEDFIQSMQFVNRLGIAAEAAQHHPDIDIRYSKVTVALSTHDSGGITEKDFALAQEADAVAER